MDAVSYLTPIHLYLVAAILTLVTCHVRRYQRLKETVDALGTRVLDIFVRRWLVSQALNRVIHRSEYLAGIADARANINLAANVGPQVILEMLTTLCQRLALENEVLEETVRGSVEKLT